MLLCNVRVVIVAVVVAAIAGDAQAGERKRWVHDKGSIENSSGKKWVETIVIDGKAVEFRFEEVGRNGDYIEIWDEGRDCYVRIYDGEFYVKNIKDGFKEFKLFYRGKWKE